MAQPELVCLREKDLFERHSDIHKMAHTCVKQTQLRKECVLQKMKSARDRLAILMLEQGSSSVAAAFASSALTMSAIGGHGLLHRTCPLLGVKRT